MGSQYWTLRIVSQYASHSTSRGAYIVFFCHCARIVAVLALLFSIFMFWTAYMLSRSAIDQAATQAQIDMDIRLGATLALFAIGLGCLGEIGLALRRLPPKG